MLVFFVVVSLHSIFKKCPKQRRFKCWFQDPKKKKTFEKELFAVSKHSYFNIIIIELNQLLTLLLYTQATETERVYLGVSIDSIKSFNIHIIREILRMKLKKLTFLLLYHLDRRKWFCTGEYKLCKIYFMFVCTKIFDYCIWSLEAS